MTGPELQALADSTGQNPYYLAYALATGAKTTREAYERDHGHHEYVIWNCERWYEQAVAEGVKRLEFVSAMPGAHERHVALCAAFVPPEKESAA